LLAILNHHHHPFSREEFTTQIQTSSKRDLKKVSASLYFQRKWKEGVGWGMGFVGCHVTSQQGKPVDLVVSVRVATKL
jgi:hypothetical protein